MPDRLALLWHVVATPWMVASATGSILASAAGGLTMLAMNAEGWSAALAALGVGVGVFIVRTAPPLAKAIGVIAPAIADAIRQIGIARAEVRGRLAKELSQTNLKVEGQESRIEQLEAEIVAAHAETKQVKDERDAAAGRRKAEREYTNLQMLRMEERLRHLDRVDRRIEPRVDRNEVAIDLIAGETRIAIPPPLTPDPDPEEDDAGDGHAPA